MHLSWELLLQGAPYLPPKITAVHCQQILAAKIFSHSNCIERVPTSQEPKEAVLAVSFYVLHIDYDQALEGKAQHWPFI